MKIVSEYNKRQSPDIELEVRTVIEHEIFIKLYDELRKLKLPMTISQTIDLINRDSFAKKLTTVIFKDGKKIEKQYWKKSSLLKPEFRGKYKISLSREEQIKQYEITSPDIIRIKLRISVLLEDWQLDITLVKELYNMADLKSQKDKILFNINTDNFSDEAPFDVIDRIEMEMEYKGNTLMSDDKIDNIIRTVFNMIDPNLSKKMEYQDEIYRLATHIIPSANQYKFKNKFGLKHLTVQVKPVNRLNLPEIKSQLDNFYITDKADGIRVLVYNVAGHSRIISSEIQTYDGPDHEITICDAELVGKSIYIFDVYYYKGERLLDKKLEERLEYFSQAAKEFPNIKCYSKTMFKATNKNALQKYMKSLPYTNDGYILTSNTSYADVKVYKLKHTKDITIDFLVKECPKSMMGIEPYNKVAGKTLYLLFSGINNATFKKYGMKKIQKYNMIFGNDFAEYSPIQFSPSSDPFAYLFYSKDKLDNKICELYYGGDSWELRKIREDRNIELERGTYFGNDFSVAENIWQSYSNPVHLEDLYNTLPSDYFQEHANPLYKDMRSFNSYVKSQILEKHKTAYAIDLASGKGQDLNRYASNNFEHVLFVDIDKSALQELVNRKQNIKSGMRVSIVETNLNDNFKNTVQKIRQHMIKPVNLVVLNFAMHYLVGSMKEIENLVTLIDVLVAPNGKFIFTTFDGKTIHGLGDYNIYEGEVLKYSIKKKFQSSSLEIGQKIDVILPFTNGEYYEENLVNINFLIDQFKLVGFNKLSCDSFAKYISTYGTELSKIDQDFVSLYSVVVLQKSPKAAYNSFGNFSILEKK